MQSWRLDWLGPHKGLLTGVFNIDFKTGSVPAILFYFILKKRFFIFKLNTNNVLDSQQAYPLTLNTNFLNIYTSFYISIYKGSLRLKVLDTVQET